MRTVWVLYFSIWLTGTDIGMCEDDFSLGSFEVNERKRLIIDTDAGSDDAVAILNVLGAEDLFHSERVELITAVHGNTNVDNVGKNVLKILKTAGRLDIPVYKGANESLVVTPKVGYFFGEDGFGDFDFPDPPSEDFLKKEHAAVALVEAASRNPGDLVLICLGPLTNIALATRLDPKFLKNLKEIFILGGSDSGVGNVKPGVEFNFYVDPEAAFIVLREAEKMNKILNVVTWETALSRSTIDMNWRKNVLGEINSPQVELINNAERLNLEGEQWISSDSILSSVVIDGGIVENSEEYHADVEIQGMYSRGALIVDYENSEKRSKNVRIIKNVNIVRFKELLMRNLDPLKGGEMTLVQPTPEQQLKIRSELNENVDTRAQDLQTIKEWLELQPHLPKAYDDGRLMTFLRGCKFSLEKTKRKLDMYFTMRTAIPEFFSNRNPFEQTIQDMMKSIHIPPLPGLTPEGRRVIVMRGVDKDQVIPNVAEAMKVVFMIGDIRLLEESTGVAGDVYILDASAATPAHFAKFTPTLIKKFLVCAQEAYPVKLKEVHIVNVSPLVDTIVNFVKPFLKEKIRNRIFFHTDGYESLYKYIPKEMLPEEYGGFAGPVAEINEQWLRKMETYKDWFLQQEEVKADENKRPGKPKTHDDLFGVEGSFRKLVID